MRGDFTGSDRCLPLALFGSCSSGGGAALIDLGGIDIRAAIVIKIRTQHLSDKCNHHETKKSMTSFQHFTPVFYFSLILGQLFPVHLARGMNKIRVYTLQLGTASY